MSARLLAAIGIIVAFLPRSSTHAEDTAGVKAPITAVAFSPDGKSVVVGSQLGIEIRSWPALEPQKSFKTPLAHVHDLAFSPDGKLLAAAGGSPGEKGQVERFDWPEGKSRDVVAPHDDLVYRVAWSKTGESFATASADQRIFLAGTYLSGHSRSVLAVAFLPDGDLLVSAGVDQSLRVWNVKDGRLLRTLDNHTAAVNDLAVRPGTADGPPVVASAGSDRTVRLWQPTLGRLMRFARLPSAPLAIAWTKGGERLVASCVDGRVRVLDPETVQISADLPALSGWAYSLAISPDDKFAVVGGEKLVAVKLP